MPVVNSKPPLEPRRHDQENVVIILKDFLKGSIRSTEISVSQPKAHFLATQLISSGKSELKQLGFQEMFGSWQSFDLIGFFKSQKW